MKTYIVTVTVEIDAIDEIDAAEKFYAKMDKSNGEFVDVLITQKRDDEEIYM